MLKNEEYIQRIKNLILNSLLEEAIEKEQQELKEWLAHSENNRRLYGKITSSSYLEARSAEANFVSNNLLPNPSLLDKPKGLLSNDKLAIDTINRNIVSKSKSTFKKRASYLLKVAAVALLLVSGALLIMNINKEKHYELHPTKVSVILGKGKPLVLTDANHIAKLMAKGLKVYGDTLDYSTASFSAKSIHTLNVPKKRSYTVKLQDGSCVVLNSESTIIYPGKFPTTKREVEINGEAYFEVNRDIEKPFLVKTTHQEIMVTGTAFNVKAYSYEKTVNTTLVEGSVKVKYSQLNGEESYAHLKPNEHFTLEVESREANKREVDVNKYISWKDGIYFFESERLEEIMNNISRWYGLTVMFKSENLKEIILSGKLRRDENPTHLIKTIGNLNSVEIIKSDNLIMIKEKSIN